MVVCGVEDHLSAGDGHIRPELPHEFETVYRRHEDVRDDERRTLSACERQALSSICGFDDFVPLVSEQRDDQLAIHRDVIDNQYLRHRVRLEYVNDASYPVWCPIPRVATSRGHCGHGAETEGVGVRIVGRRREI